MAMISARAGGPQCFPSSSRSTNSPSENSVRISASSIACLTVSEPLSTETVSSAAMPIPAATASTDAFRMLPRNRPDRAAAAATSAPSTRRDSEKSRLIARVLILTAGHV